MNPTQAIAFARASWERLIRIPSISGDPSHADDVHRCAELVRDLLAEVGLADIETLDVGGALPTVLARRPARDGAPTVLLYAHHDVQPVQGDSGWLTDPFEPVARDGRLYGRGAADDKVAIAIHLAAVAALDPDSPLGITVLVEADEEIGSPGADLLISELGEKLEADAIVITDGVMNSAEEPALTTSLRGLVDCVVEVRTFAQALHSGDFGGVFPDAGMVLARMLASLHDADGNVAIDGLASELPVSETGPDERELAASMGAVDGLGRIGKGSTARRLWQSPSVSILAVDAPAVAEAGNSLLPSARAKVSLRVPPGKDPASAMRLLEAHLRLNNPWNAEVQITPGSRARPFLATADGPWTAAMREAMTAAWGRQPAELGAGSSIPLVACLQDLNPRAEILITGVADPAARLHGPNESMDLESFARHCRAEAAFLAAERR